MTTKIRISIKKDATKRQTNNNLLKYKMIDLFAGTGGFTYSFESTHKVETVWANDFEPNSKKMYQCNFSSPFILQDFNDIEVQSIPNCDILTAGFPCFISGTKVQTLEGYKNIENVTLQDKLLTHTGKFQRILNTQQKIYNGDLYEFKIDHHPNMIKCTSDHPFYVRTKRQTWDDIKGIYIYHFEQPSWKKAIEITGDDYFGKIGRASCRERV